MLRSRMKKDMDELALRFSSSIEHDENIFYYDILVDAAHVLTLHKSGYLSDSEAREILEALKFVRDSGYKDWNYEDIHEAIEAEVTKLTPAGAKMHTARSRNDEVATCLRMFARDHLLSLAENILAIQRSILQLAEKNDAVMPGFTHLQFAQPTRLSHHLLAYHDMLERDFQRAIEAFRRSNRCPLGSAAFASTPYEYDRRYVAKLLGFDGLVEHSEDAVAARDFVIDAVYAATSTLLSLSRIAEEIVLFSTEFDFIELPDEFASTSSIMPQKKNPDIAELVRANAAKLIGNLTAVMSIYKAMPFSYNRDFQEMNPLLYESLKRAEIASRVMSDMLARLNFKTDVMAEKAAKGFAAATQLADMLVMKYNVPFRIAHRIVGRLAMEGKTRPKAEDVRRVAKEFGLSINVSEADVTEALNVQNIVESRKNIGGTAKAEVERMIAERKRKLKDKAARVERFKSRISLGLAALRMEAEKLGVNNL